MRTTTIEAWHLVPVFLIVIFLVLRSQRRRGRSPGHQIATVLFAIYLLNVARYTIFPLRIDMATLGPSANTFRYSVNLVPFRFGTDYELLGAQMVGNLILLVPFSFGLPFVSRLSLKNIVVLGALLALLLESLQLGVLIMVGGRTVDINDVILNSSGVLIGLALFLFTARTYSSIFVSKRFENGLWQHFHDTLMTAGERNRNLDRDLAT